MHVRVALLLALASLAGCGDDDVALFVDIRTDMTPVTEFDELLVELRDDRGLLGEVLRETRPGVSSTRDYGAGQRAADFVGLTAGAYTVRVVALLGPEELVDVLVPIEVLTDRAITVELTRACRGVVCPAGSACLRGICVEPACIIGESMACGNPIDAGLMDAEAPMPDAEASDAGLDGGVGADAGAACDDGTPDMSQSMRCTSCTRCSLTGDCASEWDTCNALPECADYMMCIEPCGMRMDPTGCFGACAMAHPTGSMLYLTALRCSVCVECAVNCGANPMTCPTP